jgi:hypothetical protein
VASQETKAKAQADIDRAEAILLRHAHEAKEQAQGTIAALTKRVQELETNGTSASAALAAANAEVSRMKVRQGKKKGTYPV